MRRHLLAAIALTALTSAASAQDFKAVWVAGPGDIWAVGGSGAVMHGSGGAWTSLPSGTSSDLRAVWGSSPRDVWIVGEGGTILRWNGTALARLAAPVSADFIAVHGCSANDVWVLGQSEDERQPPTLLHWTGAAFVPQQLSVAFRPYGIAGVCAVGGGGGGGLVIAGSAFFDPRPTERRMVGVVARLQNGTWVPAGWNGRAVTDETLGGTAWTGIASNGTVTLLMGGENNSVLLLSGRTGWTRLPAPPGEFESVTITGDGSPVLIMDDGFARYTGGQWRVVGGPQTQAQPDRANQEEMQRMTVRLGELAGKLQAGRMTAAEQAEFIQIQTRLSAVTTGMQGQIQAQMAQATRSMTLQFGNRPAVFAGRAGNDFYVASSNGGIFHVTGDDSQLVYSMMCNSQPTLCAASAPAPAATPKPGTRPSGAPRPARRP